MMEVENKVIIPGEKIRKCNENDRRTGESWQVLMNDKWKKTVKKEVGKRM